jgi:hypothetical protein
LQSNRAADTGDFAYAETKARSANINKNKTVDELWLMIF